MAQNPTGATINAATGVISWPVPANFPVGTFANFKVVLSDGSLSSYMTYSVRLREPNVAPVLDSIADRNVTAATTLRIDARATDANLDTLTYSLDAASIARGLSIHPTNGRITWTTNPSHIDPNPPVVTVTASDGLLSDSKSFTVTVVADTTPPTLSVAALQTSVPIGDAIDLRVLAIDDVAVVSRTLRLESVTPFTGGPPVTFNLDLPLTAAGFARLDALPQYVGTLRFVATAVDATNPPVTAFTEVNVTNPAGVNGPVVNLLPPTSGTITAPTDLPGTVTDDGTVSWTLSVSPADSSGSETWSREIGRGSAQHSVAAALGQFDPTILANGSYRVTLQATDNDGNVASDSEFVTVDSQLKLGNFSLSFTDLEIPVAGIPITIRRTYDTLNAAEMGDFGYGWKLDIVQPTLSVDRGTTGPPTFGPGGSYPTFINGTRVTVMTPEGTEESFNFKWVQVGDGYAGIGLSQSWGPSFTPASGENKYRLVAPNNGSLFRRLTDNGPFQDDYGNLYSALSPNFGGAFELVEADHRGRGLTYTISAATKTGVKVADKYGNGLRFTDNAITSVYTDPDKFNNPDGLEVDRGRQVTINRGYVAGNEVITSIVDPAGGTLTYQYDFAGRLVSFYDRRGTQRLVDANPNNDFQPTRFRYNLAESIRRHELAGGKPIDDVELAKVLQNLPGGENYLSTITDPLGVDALRADYARDGRLGGLLDANGNASKLQYEISAAGSTVRSSTAGLSQTQTSFDSRNRLIREQTASGQVTIYTYQFDASRYPYQTIQVVGDSDGAAAWADRSGDDRVTTRQYHAEFEGSVTTETDPDGNTTITAYNTWNYNKGTPSVVYHPDGTNTNYHWFDLTGDGGLNLVYQEDSYGNRTQYGYDKYGNVTQLTQANTLTGTSTSTGFVFNSLGDMVQVIDADGNVREIEYDTVGRQTGTVAYHYPTDDRPPSDPVFGSPLPASGGGAGGEGYAVTDFPPTRTKLQTVSDLDAAGDVTTSYTLVTPQAFNPTTFQYDDLTEPQIRNAGSLTEFDALGRAYKTTDENGRQSLTIFDARGLAIETRTESPDEDGTGVWLVSRTVFDSEGRAVYSTGSFPESVYTDAPDQITGTHSIYEPGTGRMLESRQLAGLTIDIVGQASSLSSVLTTAGTVISFSRSFYDQNDRVVSTENDYGLRSQTLYDDNSRVIESRSESYQSTALAVGWCRERSTTPKARSPPRPTASWSPVIPRWAKTPPPVRFPPN